MQTSQGFTVQGRFVSADDAEIDTLMDMMERYGAVDPCVSIGGGFVGATAYYLAHDPEAAKGLMLDGLSWMPCLELEVL